MSNKTGLLTEYLFTHIKIIRALNTIYALMCFQTGLLNECQITHWTCIRALTSMYALMFYEADLLIECLITHMTSIIAYTSIYALMCCNVVQLNACIITHKYFCLHQYECTDVFELFLHNEFLLKHITRITALTTVYALMCYETALLSE
jgi:hypothetical protein